MEKLVEESTVLKWLWLSLICGPGSHSASRLLSHFGYDIDLVYNASKEEYAEVSRLSADKIKRLCNKNLNSAKEILAYCSNYRIDVLTPDHDRYPSRLRMISDPPLTLYVRGNLPDLESSLCVAVVGTRSMTEYGRRISYLMGHDLGKGGAVVISGMAKGVDGMAHRGCLDGGGKTVAVLGCGVDRCYPPEHEQLMADILRFGAVISEYPPFTPPYGKNFPLRNRIISGLCQATVVTEANEISGALITARTALLQGRDLFAMPGKIGEENSIGVNDLLRQNAHIATEALDILTVYHKLYPTINLSAVPMPAKRDKNYLSPINREATKPEKPKQQKEKPFGYERYRPFIEKPTVPPSATEPRAPRSDMIPKQETDQKASAVPSKPLPPLSETEELILRMIPQDQIITADALVNGGASVKDVLTALTTLEIKGLIQALPGGAYQRIL